MTSSSFRLSASIPVIPMRKWKERPPVPVTVKLIYLSLGSTFWTNDGTTWGGKGRRKRWDGNIQTMDDHWGGDGQKDDDCGEMGREMMREGLCMWDMEVVLLSVVAVGCWWWREWGGIDLSSCSSPSWFQDHNPAGWCFQPHYWRHMISRGSCLWGKTGLHICPRRNAMVPESASSPGVWKQITWCLRNIPMHVSRKTEQNKPSPPEGQEMWSASLSTGEVKPRWRSLAFANEETQKLLI